MATGDYSKAYLMLAIDAGRQAHLACAATVGSESSMPELQAVAGQIATDDEAREIRDGLWEEYERRLRDVASYTLTACRQWLAEHGADVGLSSVHRDRERAMRELRRIEYAAEQARSIIDAAEAEGETDLLRAGRIAASTAIFNALMRLGPDALSELSPRDTLKMFRELAVLSKAHAETDLINARLAELQRKFDAEVTAAQQREPDGKLSDRQIQEIRKAVFGEVAA
jgi:hypothetical protein